MPLGAAGATAIQAGSEVLSTGLNALFTGFTNRANRKWSNQQYDKQYNDNIKFWQMQNEYNTPQAQMQRYEQAGLNKNLIYGQGNSGNAGSISTPDVQPVQFKSPDFTGVANAGSKISQFQDYQIKQAQIDGMKLDNESRAIRNVTSTFEQQDQSYKTFERQYKWDNKLHETQANALREDLRQKQANVRYSLDENDRKNVMQASNLREAVERVLSSKAQRAKTADERANIQQALKLLQQDETIKAREIKMRELGWTPGSPGWMGVVTTFINNLIGNN